MEEVDMRTLIESLRSVDPCELIASEPSSYFNVSKRTLLMFKKAFFPLLRTLHCASNCATNVPAMWYSTCLYDWAKNAGVS